MKVLVLNSGSSSLKYKVLDMPYETDLASGRVEKIGEPEGSALLAHASNDGAGFDSEVECRDHRQALKCALDAVSDPEKGCISDIGEIGAVGHRVVHGGNIFLGPTPVTDETLKQMKEFTELAPLHMPANIAGIEACRELLPVTPQIAHFDTSFYQSMPMHSRLYPVPMEWHERYGVRRYGFHGISHQFVTTAAAELLGIPLRKLKLISAHLGNGASITAFKEGGVLDTSMGFTPLEGLMMGTRCGYLDPAVIPYIASKTGATPAEIERILNNESGLAAISGVGRDMRKILAARNEGDERAELAFRMFVHTLRKYIGAYFFAMGGADAVVFTGGIGENSPEVRAEALRNLARWGIRPDKEKNENITGRAAAFINAPSSEVKLMVIPTNEELMIARETYKLVETGA